MPRSVNEVEPTPEPPAADLEFRFVSGSRVLDLLCTRADRHRRPVERLREPRALDCWLRAAGLPVAQGASRQDLRDTRRLRETVNRITRTVLAGEPPAGGDLAELNEWARQPQLAPQADANLQRIWMGESPVHGAMALIACEAVQLLTGPDRRLIRECGASPDCSLLYLDRSRGLQRRWCAMDVCGSRAKMRSYRQRQRTG